MYVRITVEVWQQVKEPETHKATVNLPEEFVSALAKSNYAEHGNKVYVPVISIGYNMSYVEGLVRALGFVLTAAYRKYLKANP